jgi:hypothetical protein
MALEFKRSNIIQGGLIYALGDSVAALITDDFDWYRMVGIMIIGATLYAFEIPNYFKWIDRKIQGNNTFKSASQRALLAMLYFNPLWIARHILLIRLFTASTADIGWNLLVIGGISFLVNIPVSFFANYLIQNKINLKHRFIASAIFSGIMAVYYSLSDVLFS